MAKSTKPKAEQIGAFTIHGRVAHVQRSLSHSSGAMVDIVVVETADQERSAMFEVFSDYGNVCMRGSWVSIDYHLTKNDKKVVDGYRRINTMQEVPQDSNHELESAVVMSRRAHLIIDACCGTIEGVEEAITKGVDVDCVSAQGYGALHGASAAGHEKCVRALVSAGANVNLPNATRETPAHWAASNDRLDCLRELAQAGADIDKPDAHGETPVFYAAINDNQECLEFLIERGARVDVVDRAGKTAKDHAIESSSPRCVELLQAAELRLAEKAILSSITAGMVKAPRAPARSI